MNDDGRDLPLDDETLALIVHELRGPLTVIVGYLDLLAKPLDDDERTAVVGAVRRAALRLDRMLDDVAEGRGPTCSVRLTLETVPLDTLVRAVVEDWRASTGRAIEFTPADAPVVRVDEHRIEAALGNLLANAGKYSPPDAPIRVTLETRAGMAVVGVEDQGPGIPVEDRQRVLARFERLTRDSEAPGSGLGLAVVREIAEAHGGGVTIDEGAHGGARISIELPLA